MGRGKYSPAGRDERNTDYSFNCYGQVPDAWDETTPKEVVYDEKVHFGNYDKDGFDSYGYSAFDAEGNYVGIGDGVDRNGYTEREYMVMSDDEFENCM
jgi:hypothetical protein